MHTMTSPIFKIGWPESLGEVCSYRRMACEEGPLLVSIDTYGVQKVKEASLSDSLFFKLHEDKNPQEE